MPQKNGKKAKVDKSKKPAKSAKASSLGGALKKAAKAVVKKLGASNGKKPAPAKAAKAAKAVKAEKKAAPAAKALPQKKKPLPPPAPAKEKKSAEKAKSAAKAPAPAPAAKPAGKKKPEIVVEVPAPKGVALLKGEGKKSRKAAAEGGSASARKRCREPGCDHDSLLSGYCRLHYIKNWRKIKRKEAILASGQLNNYVEELVSKYPDKYLDVIRQDLASEKDWAKVVVDLELESAEEDASGDEDLEGVAEGVGRTSARGEFDDDSESF